MISVLFTPRALTDRVPFVFPPTTFTSNVIFKIHGNRFMTSAKRSGKKRGISSPVVSLIAVESALESVRNLGQLLTGCVAISSSTSARPSRNESEEAPSCAACVYLAHHPVDILRLLHAVVWVPGVSRFCGNPQTKLFLEMR